MTSELAIITFSDEVMELPSGSCLCGGTDLHCASLIKLTLTRLNLHMLTVIGKGSATKGKLLRDKTLQLVIQISRRLGQLSSLEVSTWSCGWGLGIEQSETHGLSFLYFMNTPTQSFNPHVSFPSRFSPFLPSPSLQIHSCCCDLKGQK